MDYFQLDRLIGERGAHRVIIDVRKEDYAVTLLDISATEPAEPETRASWLADGLPEAKMQAVILIGRELGANSVEEYARIRKEISWRTVEAN